jgi:hypothetical protein
MKMNMIEGEYSRKLEGESAVFTLMIVKTPVKLTVDLDRRVARTNQVVIAYPATTLAR